MYLKSIKLENVGPITHIELTLPFAGELPKPVVLVGPNGSGKSTFLSFIVNALVAFKQQVFEEAEVESAKVYRLRSAMFLRGGANYYHTKVQLEEGLQVEEWVLDRPRERFATEVQPAPTDAGWQSIQPSDNNLFSVTPSSPPPPFRQQVNPAVEKLFSQNAVLFFPSDRFEPPDWLNQTGLSADLRFPEPINVKGLTARRIFSRSLLKPTLEWLQAVVLDWFLTETKTIKLPNPTGGQEIEASVRVPGRNGMLLTSTRRVLGKIFGVEQNAVSLSIDQRNIRRFSAIISRGADRQMIPNLLGLSAGQSALFCLFCSIIRDFDLAGAPFSNLEDIRGIVVVDEADLHLHMDLQYRVLPELMQLFPKVQFIVTAQSPFFALGMNNVFGEDGFLLLQLPDGRRIPAETYSEFRDALDTFRRTSAFEQELMKELRSTSKPVVLCEGKTDAIHLNTAWEKLYPGINNPFQIVGCGDGSSTVSRGGVKTLKAMLEALAWFEDRSVTGVFDNDRAGAEQFKSLKNAGFQPVSHDDERKHSSRNIQALLIPTPRGRELFAPPAIRSRVLEIEHYYSDALLQSYGVKGDALYGSPVYEIRESQKSSFAQLAPSFDPAEFAKFHVLFDRLFALTGTARPA